MSLALGLPASQSQGGEGGKGSAGEGGDAATVFLEFLLAKNLKNTVAGLTTYPSLRARVRKEREGRGQQWSAGRPATVFLD